MDKTTDQKNTKTLPKGCQFGCASLIIILILAALIGTCMLSGQNRALKKSKNPAEIARLIIDFEDKKAASVTTEKSGIITIIYNADPWAGTKGYAVDKFCDFTTRIIPVLFEKIPGCKKVIIRATATLTDIRGNSDHEEILAISFTRENSNNTRWDRVLYKNIPKFADFFYAHPSLNLDI